MALTKRKKTNKQKKQLPNNTVERFVFFDFIPIIHGLETNKQKKNFQRKKCQTFMQRVKKKASTIFFFRFSSKSRLVNVVVDVRFGILLQPTFVFAQRLFCCYQKKRSLLVLTGFFFLGFWEQGVWTNK